MLKLTENIDPLDMVFPCSVSAQFGPGRCTVDGCVLLEINMHSGARGDPCTVPHKLYQAMKEEATL